MNLGSSSRKGVVVQVLSGAERFWSLCEPSAAKLESVGVVMTVITVLVVVTTAASFVHAGSIKRRFVRQLPPKPPGTAAEARSDCLSPLQPTINSPSRQIVRREGPSEPRREADSGGYLVSPGVTS